MPTEELRGSYRFEDGRFVPLGDMAKIQDRISTMRLLADTGDGVPSFYVDPDGTFWEYVQMENYETTLRQVNRAWITANYPTVDPDRPLDAQ